MPKFGASNGACRVMLPCLVAPDPDPGPTTRQNAAKTLGAVGPYFGIFLSTLKHVINEVGPRLLENDPF